MEKAININYEHLYDCKPADLPREAKKALKNSSIDELVVLANSSLMGTSPSEKDIEESGINFPLREFLESLPAYCSYVVGQDEVGVYKVKEISKTDEAEH